MASLAGARADRSRGTGPLGGLQPPSGQRISTVTDPLKHLDWFEHQRVLRFRPLPLLMLLATWWLLFVFQTEGIRKNWSVVIRSQQSTGVAGTGDSKI
jgi:hypothetical protein